MSENESPPAADPAATPAAAASVTTPAAAAAPAATPAVDAAPAATPAVAPATPSAAAAPSSKTLPIVAAGFGLVGCVLAIALPGFAWLFCATAIVIAIVALAKRRRPRWLAIATLVVAPLAWLLAILVAFANFARDLDSVW